MNNVNVTYIRECGRHRHITSKAAFGEEIATYMQPVLVSIALDVLWQKNMPHLNFSRHKNSSVIAPLLCSGSVSNACDLVLLRELM